MLFITLTGLRLEWRKRKGDRVGTQRRMEIERDAMNRCEMERANDRGDKDGGVRDRWAEVRQKQWVDGKEEESRREREKGKMREDNIYYS